MATHSSIPAWRIPWTEEPGELQSMGCKESDTTSLSLSLFTLYRSFGSVVKNPPAVQEIELQSLVQEDPLEKEMATHSSILAWKIPWTAELGRLQAMGLQRVRHH